jgi:hypothetical protein
VFFILGKPRNKTPLICEALCLDKGVHHKEIPFYQGIFLLSSYQHAELHLYPLPLLLPHLNEAKSSYPDAFSRTKRAKRALVHRLNWEKAIQQGTPLDRVLFYDRDRSEEIEQLLLYVEA